MTLPRARQFGTVVAWRNAKAWLTLLPGDSQRLGPDLLKLGEPASPSPVDGSTSYGGVFLRVPFALRLVCTEAND